MPSRAAVIALEVVLSAPATSVEDNTIADVTGESSPLPATPRVPGAPPARP
jgi:hypothetical protein